MLRKLLGFMLISAGVAGCASKPVIVDNTPLNPTAVIEQQVISNGIKGFFPSESNDRHLVRANMRRDEMNFKGTGTFSGYLVGTRSGTEITRIDRKLIWSLNTEKEQYSECPLKGCSKPARQPPAQQEQKPPEAEHESGCTMHIARSSFTVKATGHKKSINGFDTDEYQAAWVVDLRDNAAGKSTSTLNLELWTTPVTGAVRDTMNVEEAYARAYSGAIAGSVKPEILPSDAAKLITAYLASSMKQGDLKAFLDAGKQMDKIKGYPIFTHLVWNMDGNACAPKESKQPKEKSSGMSTPTSAGDLVSGLAGMFVQKKTDESMKAAEGEPLFSFTFEVKKYGIESMHDSIFSVPGNYRLVSQP